MTNSPDSGQKPEPSPDRRWLRYLIRASIVAGGLTFAAGVAGAWWAWSFIQNRLAPLVEATLTETLNRPVELGEVEGVTLRGLRFDGAALPPTPTDRDRGTAEAVEVEFNLLEVLLSRRLGLNITLVRPDLFIDQTADGRWISTQVTTEDREGPIKVELDTILVVDGKLALEPSPRVSAEVEEPNAAVRRVIQISDVDGAATLRDDNQHISFEASGKPVRGGQFELRGETIRSEDRTNLAVQAQNIFAPDVSALLPLPLSLEAGRLSANLTVRFVPEQELAFNGVAQFEDAAARIANVPSRFSEANGRLRFQEQRIFLEDVEGLYGQIPARAGGSLDIEQGYDLTAEVRSTTIRDVLKTFDVTPPIALQGVFDADLRVTGAIDQPVVSGTATSVRTSRIDRVDFRRLSAQFSITPQQATIQRFTAVPVSGGEITGSGRVGIGENAEAAFTAQARNVAADSIARLYGARLPNLTLGRVSADARAFGPLNNLQAIAQWQAPQATYPGRGEIRAVGNTIQFRDTQFQVAGGTVRGQGAIANGRWQADVNASQVALSPFAPQIPGRLTGQARLSGTLANFSPSTIQGDAQGQIAQLAGGSANFRAQAGNGRWQANVNASQVALSQLSPRVPGLLSGQAQLSGSLANFSPNAIQATAQGRVTQLAGGSATFQGRANSGRWQANVNASQVALNQLLPQASGRVSGQAQLSGSLANFSPNAIQATAQAQLADLSGGTAIVRGQLANGRWQALINASQIALDRFSPDLRGLLSGDVQASGTIANLSPSGIRAQGEVRLSEGVSAIDGPLTASLQWLGDRLQIDRALAPGFSASGFVFAQLQGTPQISGVDLNLRLRGFNLAELPVALPSGVQVAGLADFDGRVQGTLSAPNVVGQASLRNFVVNDIDFEPLLAGSVRYGGEGLDLDLAGSQDRIAVQLDRRNRPVAFLIRGDQTLAEGRTQGDRLVATVQNFPLEILNFSPAAEQGFGPVGGLLSGNFSVNLNTLAAEGNVAIDQPSLGYINAAANAAQEVDRLTAEFSYANGQAVLSAGELRLNNSRYLLSGSFTAGTNPQFRGKVIANEGRIEDLLTTLQFFELADFSRGLQSPTYSDPSEIVTAPVGLPNASLLNQLRRFSEIAALQAQRQAEEASVLIPALSELEGGFTGELNFAGSAQAGVTATFDLEGTDWRWGEYGVDRVLIADGAFADGVVTLLPLRFENLSFESTDGTRETLVGSFLNFAGQVGGAEQTGQLQARSIPVGLLRDIFRLPIDIDGELNATATLSGSVANPQTTGEISISDGSLNNTPIQQATSFFSYNDARLNFTGRLVIDEPQPVTISGSFPYSFNFMTVQPDSDAISLDINVRDEGLSLLNLLQNQVAWVDGEGEVQLEVRGTQQQPIATGTARFNNATLTANTLPEPLTNVSARIQFNRSRIQVESFQGQFDTGTVTAIGVIPIFNADDAPRTPGDSPVSQPLRVDLNNLALNFKGLYNGGVRGNVVVTGSAIAPVIGGNIILSNGRVSLPDADAAVPAATAAPAAAPGGFATSPPEFDNLLITLGDRLQIIRDPILNFVASGDLQLNGSLDDLNPDGTIRLRSGQVNLFAAQFNLDRNYEHTARFSPRNGLDPYLNVRLVTSVPEVTRTPITTVTPYVSSEVAVTPPGEFGALQTVRVQASVQGLASQLFQNLELTSSPSRTENEIYALIGGGFVDTLGQNTTLAIANIASSALLTSIQNVIGNTLGLSDFRLFPTTITDDDGSANFGLAAELGVDITGNLSASVLQVLTTEQPAEFGLRYRFNDQFLLRGSTNFSGESRAVLEFQDRF